MLKKVQNCNNKKIMQDLAASTSTTKPKIHLNLVFFLFFMFKKKNFVCLKFLNALTFNMKGSNNELIQH